MTTLNLNDIGTVVLTATGTAAYNKWMLQFPERVRQRAISGQTLELPLWEIMQVFGPCIYMGMTEPPFVGNEINLRRIA